MTSYVATWLAEDAAADAAADEDDEDDEDADEDADEDDEEEKDDEDDEERAGACMEGDEPTRKRRGAGSCGRLAVAASGRCAASRTGMRTTKRTTTKKATQRTTTKRTTGQRTRKRTESSFAADDDKELTVSLCASRLRHGDGAETAGIRRRPRRRRDGPGETA